MYRAGKEEIEAIARVIYAKQLFRMGEPADGHLQEVETFEKEWAEKIGTKYAFHHSGGGTAALILGLVGLGIGPGDEVIVPAYTFMATAVAVLAVGAIPVLAEIDETLTIDPNDVEKKISKYTRAIIPVHMVGIPANLERICSIARTHNLKIVEDVAQACGGSYQGKRLGTWGEVGAFSFNYYKLLSCGEGGAVVTDDPTIYEKALVYHDSGIAFRPIADELAVPISVGFQIRASEIMGAMMRVQLQRLDGILADLRRIKRTIMCELSDIPGLRFAPSNDIEGDCGVGVAFQFDTEDAARKFAWAPGVDGWLPIDTERHVYSNWEPVLQKLAGPHPSLNPYYLPQNQDLNKDCTKDMCPRTLDILSRTVVIGPEADWTDTQIRERIEACRNAAKTL